MNFKKIKNFLAFAKQNGIDTGLSSLCYFSTSPMVLGHHFFIKKFIKNNYSLKYYFYFLKQIFSIYNAYNFTIINNNKFYNKKKIYITWGFKKDFDKSGNIKDQYFKIRSKNNNILWIVLYLDKKVPFKIAKNIILISQINSGNKFKSLLSIFYIFKIFIDKKFNFKKIVHQLSYPSALAENIFKKISNLINHNSIEKIFTPYEGQPFQHYIPNQFKKTNNKIKIYGYVSHTLPHSFDMFNRIGSPDILFLHSNDQKKYFNKNLGWEKKKLKVINSLRLKKTRQKNLNNKIYFSNQLFNLNNLSKNFEKYLKNSKNGSIPKLSINIHPRGYSPSKQNKLKVKFEKIIKKNINKFNYKSKKNISFVIGLTSTPIYLLAHKIKVIHIVNNEFFDTYNNKFWPSIKSKEIDRYIYEYSIKRSNKILNLKKKSNLLFNSIIK